MTPSEDGGGDLVRVGAVAPAVVNLPLWVAADAGLLADAGVRITETLCGTTDATTAALIDGEIDVALGTPEGALAAPETLTILAALANRPPLSLVAQPGITSIPGLRGADIGTSSLQEGTVHLVQAMLDAHGLHYPGDYRFALAGAHPQRWTALQDGSIQAALQLVPYDYLAEDAGFSMLGRAEDYVPWFAFSAVCVRTDWARTNHRLVEAFRGALLAAAARIHADPDAAAEVAARHARISPAHARRAVLRLVESEAMPSDLAVHPEAVRRTLAAMASRPAG